MALKFALAATWATLMAAPALSNDAAANDVYERLQGSIHANSPLSLLQTVYGPGATYLPAHKDLGIQGRDGVLKVMTESQRHLGASGGQLELKFRIIDRKRFKSVYVDSGYLKTTVKATTSAAPIVSYAKFVAVLAKQPEGHWAFVSDGESEAPGDSFAKAVRIEGLKFDD